MRKSLTKGTKGKLFLAIFFLLWSIVIGWGTFKNYNNQVVDMLQARRIYTPDTFRGSSVLLVSSIKKTDLEVEGKKFYIVEQPHGFVFVEASPEDIHIQNTLNELPQHRFLLVSGIDEWEMVRTGRRSRRKFYYITDSFREDMISEFKRLYPNADVNQLDTMHYASRSKYDSSEFWARVILIILFLVGVGLAFVTRDNIRENKKTYDWLRTKYPELAGNWQAIKQHAKLIDKRLGLYVYKDTLISWNVGVRCIDFNDIKSMRAEQVVVRHKRSVSYYYVLKIVRKKGKAIDLNFSYRFKKVTPVEINAFLDKLKELEPMLAKKIIFKNSF